MSKWAERPLKVMKRSERWNYTSAIARPEFGPRCYKSAANHATSHGGAENTWNLNTISNIPSSTSSYNNIRSIPDWTQSITVSSPKQHQPSDMWLIGFCVIRDSFRIFLYKWSRWQNQKDEHCQQRDGSDIK